MANPDAGWYPDPEDDSRLRLWNGDSWTAQFRAKDVVGASKSEKLKSVVRGKLADATATLETKVHQRNQQLELKLNEFTSSVEGKLSQAVELASAGDLAGQLRLVNEVVDLSAKFGGPKQVETAMASIAKLLESGHLLPPGKRIGEVQAETYMQQVGRLNSGDKGLAAFSIAKKTSNVQVFEDRVVQGDIQHAIDGSTWAQVFLDGEQQITQRPTLSRMLLLSPLPGSALLAGLALPKGKTNDNRTAEFQVGGIDWSFSVRIAPNDLSGPRSIAEQINKLADRKSAAGPNGTSATAEPANSSSGSDILAALERLASLRSSGALSDDEFAKLKSQLMEGP